MKWIITANTNDCCIYEYQANELKLIKKISHPENKLKSSELGADKPGRYQSSNTSSRGAYTPRSDIDEIYVDNFARELGQVLNESRNENDYDELVLIIPAQMDGLISKYLHKKVKELIKTTLHKNIMHLSEKELLEVLQKNAF